MDGFNRSIERLIKQKPNNKTLIAIKSYKDRFNLRDYYTTLDKPGFSIGIEFMVEDVLREKSRKIIGYIPMNGLKVILPIWHKVSKDEVQKFSCLSLADKVALSQNVRWNFVMKT